jgi:hypothetical protein
MTDLYQAGVSLVIRETLSVLEVTLCSLAPLCMQFFWAWHLRAHRSSPALRPQLRKVLPFQLCPSRLPRSPHLIDARTRIGRWLDCAESPSLIAFDEAITLKARSTRHRHGRDPIARSRPWAI